MRRAINSALGGMLAMLAATAMFTQGLGAQSFDGITVIEFADVDGQRVLKGRIGVISPYIVTYVTADGTYAAVGDGSERNCVAWAQEGSYTGSSITFGVPPTEQSVKLVTPSICQPFTLSFEAPGVVRVDAENKYEDSWGPLAEQAQTIRYSRRHRIVSRVPLKALDWGLPLYTKYSVQNVRLGPLPAMRAGLAETARVKLSPLTTTYRAIRKSITVVGTPNDLQDSRTVNGYVAAAEVLAWPWDVLYAAWYTKLLPRPAKGEALDQSIYQQYGQPSLIDTDNPKTRRITYWLFDLVGRQIAAEGSAPENCLATRKVWERGARISHATTDIGPWGCSLVVRLGDDRNRQGIVRKYEMEAMSGYTAALNHFRMRLEELRTLRERIGSVQSNPVKL